MGLNIELLKEIKNTKGTNDKIFKAVQFFKEQEHLYLSECFSKTIYNISKTNIAKAIGYDKSHYGTFEDLGEFLIIHPLGGYDVLSSTTYDYYDFSYLPMFLESIKNTSGNNQIKELQDMLIKIDPIYRPYFIRVLLKNPRLGISEATYNKIRVKQHLKPLEQWYVKLAELLEPDVFDTLDYPLVREIKYDGFRAVIFIKDNKVEKILSRAGEDMTSQFPEIVQDLNKTFTFNNGRILSCTLDGEICSKSFNSLQKRANRLKENLNTDFDLVFVCFDIINYENESLRYKTLEFRRNLLEKLYESFESVDKLKLSDYKIINNHQELSKEYEKAVINEEEGIMVKTLKSKWAIKKDDRLDWYKVKPVYTSDLQIYKAEYGNGKNKDFINILYVQDKDCIITTKVSSGMTDLLRETFTKMYKEDELIGKIVEIKYNQITGTNSLRHPRIVKLRLDKTEVDKLR